jgi:hypothetical protein
MLRDFVLEDTLFWPGEIFVKSYCEEVKRKILPSDESSRSRGFDFFSKVFKYLFCFYFPLLQIQSSYFFFFELCSLRQKRLLNISDEEYRTKLTLYRRSAACCI